MIDAARLSPARRALLDRLLPGGVPALWCPLLTHYGAGGTLDTERLARHLDALQGHVGGLLVPGSTGDGWELDEGRTRAWLEALLPLARARGMAVLVAVLKADAEAMRRTLLGHLAWLQQATGEAEALGALRAAGVCGFTVCPPSGAGLSQAAIEAGLDAVLGTGLPMALYQLPQVTGNEMAPQTVAALAARHPNALLLKDTSGADRVAAAGVRELLLVRGAEGDYARHLAAAGGAYDGFLLSTANVFAPALRQVIEDLRAGRRDAAAERSARLAAVVDTVFAAAAPLPGGNAFTRANQALDHWMAHGPAGATQPPPWRIDGSRLPATLVETAGEALLRGGLMPAQGYL
ncbi:dihydrodipicolinate synthase family protein [Piscinibacter sakaiensis]|uniref:Dihydrodipicolinate synthase n=1 Tax=Piscinibacter sakaiensis TaxID=1547922 RepID=A0A0K8P4K3_PISS1|nr:dihydrodipicolinate synthase family protein [Piscinibacter sakaiensis]GAP37603.1 dihydrodipicolinate synthase [Piscinibacter sakaiensis]